ncbi:hypothetical protein D3C72_1677760 [compost metagenome]
MPRQPLEHGLRGGAFGHQDDGGAHRQREGQAVAQAVGEEQLRGGEHHVAFLDAQHGLGIELGRVPQVAMGVDHALGLAGGTGRIQPERDLVGQGARGGGKGRAGQQGLEFVCPVGQAGAGLRHDQVFDVGLRLRQGRLRGGQQGA